MSSKIGARFAKRQAAYKARGGTKKRTARTSINTIVKRALLNAGANPNIRMGSNRPGTGYFDVGAATYAFDTTGSITLLNVVPQGISQVTRVGKRYMLSSLQHRGFAAQNAAAAINDIVMMIVYDKRPTGSLPAITDVLNAVAASAQNKDDNVPDRFMILKRVHRVLTGNSTTPATGGEAYDTDFYLPMRLPVVNKSAATGAIGDIEQGALYLITVGNNAAGTGAANLTGTFRVRYMDTQG